MAIENVLSQLSRQFSKSLVGKVFILGFIVLILLIPYFLAINLRHARQHHSTSAEYEVSSKWGGSQTIIAPVLSIPIQRMVQKKEEKVLEKSTWCIQPDMLEIESQVTPEIRYRGIYQIMLYKSEIHFKASFSAIPNAFPDDWNLVKDSKPEILFCISDVKGIQTLSAKINDKTGTPCPGNFIAFPLTLEQENKNIQFTADLELNGCRNLLFAPLGKSFSLSMESPWPHPSFTGGFLPSERNISEKGFEAKWLVNELNSSFAQNWLGSPRGIFTKNINGYEQSSDSKCLGVSLVQPAGIYQQVERVSNYAFLLVAIVLIAFLIGESVTKIWIHPLQYFFAGLSLIMFYILLLALAEHINFNLSYLLTTLTISGMTTLYCKMIFARKPSAALLLGGVMLLAYLLIFALIRLEDYALLAGTCILLVLLGVLMRATGNMNKEELTTAEQEKSKQP